ncbi:CDP-paratose 2-epimerase [candidate division BRC1 bacterium HGW-BRC1-1]|jgi:CDP-paratose 2-epimerase|nr:MAG: CDP-paratose 2-epimerase [candidate division BRC1 bacterium HGW-BRC1-1]
MAHYLITGGCGFIGSNLANTLLADGEKVTVFDNLARKGTARNLEWLESQKRDGFEFIRGDIRDADAIAAAVRAHSYDAIFHFAGQVAVTTSVTNPREDFDVNALGTFNTLEAVRLAGIKVPFLFTSTNKVYGGMEDIPVVDRGTQYDYDGLPNGVPESRGLDFHSPYGCSKGAADQYVRDYGRIYDIPTVVFRMSCQYGPRQFGNEDQGWVAHFIIAAHKGRDLNIFGDGKQVRDILYVEDLVRAFRMAAKEIAKTSGQIYNIGGGRANTISLLELVAQLETLVGHKVPMHFGDWRPGDQPVYISDISKAEAGFGWSPSISKHEGVEKLHAWVRQNDHLFE